MEQKFKKEFLNINGYKIGFWNIKTDVIAIPFGIKESCSFRIFEIPERLYREQGFSLPEIKKKFSEIRFDKLFYPSLHLATKDSFSGSYDKYFKKELTDVKTRFPEKSKMIQELTATRLTMWKEVFQDIDNFEKSMKRIMNSEWAKYNEKDKIVGLKFRELLKDHITPQELFLLEQLYLPSDLFRGTIFWQNVIRFPKLYPNEFIGIMGHSLLVISLKNKNKKCEKLAKAVEEFLPNDYIVSLIYFWHKRNLRKKDDSLRKSEERKKTDGLDIIKQEGTKKYKPTERFSVQKWQTQKQWLKDKQWAKERWEEIEEALKIKIITKRQFEVLNLIYKGLNQKEIAKQLSKSESTISELKTKVIERLQKYFKEKKE